MFPGELTAWQRKHKLDMWEKENNLKSILLSILKLLLSFAIQNIPTERLDGVFVCWTESACTPIHLHLTSCCYNLSSVWVEAELWLLWIGCARQVAGKVHWAGNEFNSNNIYQIVTQTKNGFHEY